MIKRNLTAVAALLLLPACATAQAHSPVSAPPPVAEPDIVAQPDPADFVIPAANVFCIDMMAGIPDASPAGRHQFFLLLQQTAHGAGPSFQPVLDQFGAGSVADGTPVLAVVDDIADPLTRQVAPELTVGQSAHLIRFASECGTVIDGQIAALESSFPELSDGRYKQAISEDALFLRSTLLDALYRLGAGNDPAHAPAVAAYASDILRQRGNIEFAAFDSEIDDIEAMVTGDLGTRLSMSNTQVGESADAGAVAAARASIAITAEEQRQISQRRLWELIEILGSKY